MSGSFEGLVERVFEKVKTHTGWSNKKVILWFQTKNPLFGGVTPDDYMLRRPDKMEHVIDAIISENVLGD